MVATRWKNIPPRCSYIIVEMYILCIFIVGYKFIFIDSRSLPIPPRLDLGCYCPVGWLCCCSFAQLLNAVVRCEREHTVPGGKLFCCLAVARTDGRDRILPRAHPPIAGGLPHWTRDDDDAFDGGKLDLKIGIVLRFFAGFFVSWFGGFASTTTTGGTELVVMAMQVGVYSFTLDFLFVIFGRLSIIECNSLKD